MRLIRSAFGQGRDISVQSGNGPTLMCLDLTPLCALVAVLCTVTQVGEAKESKPSKQKRHSQQIQNPNDQFQSELGTGDQTGDVSRLESAG